MAVTVIAEPGCTPEGDIGCYVELIHAAADAGADVFKAQWVSDPELLARRRNAGDYGRFYRWISFPLQWHEQFAALCKTRGIAYACTSYLAKDVWVVDPYVSLHKVSSFEADDSGLVRTALATGKPVLLSTGQMDEGQLWCSSRVQGLEVLHCVSAYPTPADEANIGAVRTYSMAGYSDHTTHPLAGALAVAMGAKYVEAHLRMAKTDPKNPDFAAAMDPTQFAAYVQNIRDATRLLGDGKKRIMPSEQPMTAYRVQYANVPARVSLRWDLSRTSDPDGGLSSL